MTLPSDDALLELRSLRAGFSSSGNFLEVLRGVDFSLATSATLGIAGESGCGKSLTALSILGLLPKPNAELKSGEILFRGRDLLKLSPPQMRGVRGSGISMVFQDAMSSLNPVRTVGSQLSEAIAMHDVAKTRGQLRDVGIELLRSVGIPAAEHRMRDYPHQLSGGMQQRVMIAMALASKPQLLIADEPTTALDLTIQAQILKLLKDIQSKTQMAVLFISHDLAVIADLCDAILVMYAGEVVESASVEDFFAEAFHPYSRGLLASLPRLDLPPKTSLQTIAGGVVNFASLPPGCAFAPRCPYAKEDCSRARPSLFRVSERRLVRCFLWRELAR